MGDSTCDVPATGVACGVLELACGMQTAEGRNNDAPRLCTANGSGWTAQQQPGGAGGEHIHLFLGAGKAIAPGTAR